MIKNSRDQWGLAARLMHGLGMILVFALVIHGWWMTEFLAGESRFPHYQWHGSMGYTVMLLTVIRLVWRGNVSSPEPPEGALRWERNLAWLGHMGLYLFTLVAALQGWALAGTFSQPLEAKLLGIIPMPMIMSGSELHEVMEELHGNFAWTLAILVALHIIAACYHQFYKKDHVIRRMFG